MIVGAGPVGLYIGERLSSEGYNVAILEEHSEIGNPCHCSGLFSTHIFDIVGKIGVLHPAKRARIHAPNGEVLEIGNERIRGFVVDRVEFDRELARRAVNRGAELHLKTRVKGVEYPRVYSSTGEYRARIIIGADGINSVVRKSMEVKIPRIIGAIQAIARYESDDIERVEIFLGNEVAPGFFAWIIPLFDDLAKVGLASYVAPWHYLRSLMKKFKLKPLSIQGGGIPIGSVKRTYAKGTVIVGDAASQVKATSGGGVYPGLISATCAVETAIRALEIGNFTDSTLFGYERCWHARIGKELKRAYALHKLYRKLKDEDFNRIVRDLKDEEILRIINEYGDIDYPSHTVFKILKKKPSILKYLSIPARPYRRRI